MTERIIPHKELEVVLKKRKRGQIGLAKSIANEIKNKTRKPSVLKKIRFKRAEKFIKEFRSKEHFDVQLQRRSKRANIYDVPVTPKLIFAIRIRTPLDVHTSVGDVLNLLRLNKTSMGVFLNLNNKTTMKLLKLIEPYVTWGTPSMKMIRDMIFKRGHANTGDKRVALTDNKIIEDHLGKFDIICLEDLIHEIVTLGPHFKDVNTLIWHMKLNEPIQGWKKFAKPFGQGGDYGDRGDKINDLLKEMI